MLQTCGFGLLNITASFVVTEQRRPAEGPLVSVLMSVFNGEAFLAEAIESILNQTFADFEFVIVDDGSVDRTAEILAKMASRDTRIRVLSQENRGLIAALNRGVSEARGRYIARMDADDVSMPDRFAKQVAYLEERPTVGVVGGAMMQIDSDGKERGVRPSIADPQTITECLAVNSPIAHPTTMIRRQLLVDIGGYRPAFRHAEDYDLWLRMSEHATLANLSDVLLRYRAHGENVSMKFLLGKFESALLARASARARGRGAGDPAEGLTDFPGDFVERFLQAGESDGWLKWESAPVMAARAADGGNLPEADMWLRKIDSRHKGQQRRMLVERLVLRARKHFSMREFHSGYRLLRWAFRLRPTRAVKALFAGHI